MLAVSAARASGADAACALVLGCSALAGCSSEAPPRRQTILFVDTDMAIADQTRDNADLASDATLDTVRVDVLSPDDRVIAVRELSATSHLDWPLSFGVAPPAEGAAAPTRLRIRAFRAADAIASVEGTTSVLDPPPELAVDRIVEIAAPGASVIERRVVVLSGDCLGRPTSFRARTTCADGARPTVAFTEPLGEATLPIASRAGTWPRGHAEPCANAAPPDRRCIPGGVSVLGSREVAGYEDDTTLPSVPLRVAYVPPFLMDAHEFTVGRARPLVSLLTSEHPHPRGDPTIFASDYCTWSESPSNNDELPLNCLRPETAAELCALAGGELPTEAEWNHAATGRGERRRFPWGDAFAGCCNASVSRVSIIAPAIALCRGDGPERVGSHPLQLGCAGVGDVSRDGVFDLGGSVTELVADAARPLDDPCWGDGAGILVAPRCSPAPPREPGARGGNWTAGPLRTVAAFRGSWAYGVGDGFRCVYHEAR
jgi:formylglycine-generating enzyme required for sulfatase activity